MYIGSHVSIRNGYLGAARTVDKLGGNALQYFPKNPRGLSIKAFDQSDADACAQFCREKGILSIAHTPYPTNLAVDEPELKQVTIKSILNDLDIVEACGSVGLVVHFGKYKGSDPLQGYKNIIQLLNEVLSEWKGKALVLIENQAGEGTNMGTTLEELVQIRSLTQFPEKIGFCLDTCHAFASGLWDGMNWKRVEAKGEQLGYFQHLKAIHLNDSLYPTGSKRDRHANVGQGYIGAEGIKQILSSKYLADVAIVLETPTPSGGSHRDEIAFVRELATNP